MVSTWIKLHRKLIDNPIIMNAELLQLFIYCLLRANHKDNNFIWNGKSRLVKRGSFITGLHVLCEALNQKQTSLYRRLITLQELGYIKIKTENKYSEITIVKYDTYQSISDELGKQTENKRKTNGKQTETNNNDNNEKNDKIKDCAIPFDTFWHLYDKKVGDKTKLEKTWIGLTDEIRAEIMAYIPKYKLAQPDKKFRKNPQTFFNNKSWNDELVGLKEEKPKPVIDYKNLWGKVAE